MGRSKLTVKAKKNIFTITKEAQDLLDALPAGKKSKTVSEAIINHLSKPNDN